MCHLRKEVEQRFSKLVIVQFKSFMEGMIQNLTIQFTRNETKSMHLAASQRSKPINRHSSFANEGQFCHLSILIIGATHTHANDDAATGHTDCLTHTTTSTQQTRSSTSL